MEKTNQKKTSDKLTRRVSVCFSDEEYKAIAKKAMAFALKPSSAIRIWALKGVGYIQMNLFKD